MLDQYYSNQFETVVSSLECGIELPISLTHFFAENGEASPIQDEERMYQRLRARTKAIFYFERALPAIPRNADAQIVFTSDFSRVGCGFLSAFEIYPEEHVRLLLPTFWVQLKAVRARRLGSKCYEIGATLSARHDRSIDAFDLQ